MSECVVRMNIPKSCSVCPFMRTCERYKDWLDGKFEKIKPTCPGCKFICSLPEGHGRLGDLDELGRKINGARIRAMQDGQDTNPYWECGDIIASEQTIVPAEAERSET